MRRAVGRMMVVMMVVVGVAACAKRAPEAAPEQKFAPPPASSPLAKVQVGMSAREVETILGPPQDENAYMTGKAFIPFFYGRDRWRRAYFYKGLGRVVFAGSGGFSQSAHVQHVEYDPTEDGRSR